MEIFSKDNVYDFMGKRLAFLGFSSILFVASIILLLTKGLTFGIDFAGGTLVQVKYEQLAPIDNIRETLKNTKYSNSTITKFGNDEEVVIRITGSSSDLTNDVGDEMHKILASTGEFEIRHLDALQTGSIPLDATNRVGIGIVTLNFIKMFPMLK